MNTKSKRIIVFLSIVAIACLIVYRNGQRFRRDHSLTIGEITTCTNGGKGNFGPGIKYIYTVNGIQINGSRRHSELIYSIHEMEHHTFPVVYNKSWFGYNDVILITPNDFAYYGYSFPDSLKWILKYVNKQ